MKPHSVLFACRSNVRSCGIIVGILRAVVDPESSVAFLLRGKSNFQAICSDRGDNPGINSPLLGTELETL